MNYHDVLLNRRVVYDAACPESMWGEAQELAIWFAIPQILGMVTGRKPTPATPVALEDHIDHYPLRSSLDADDPELNPMRAIRRNALLNPFNGQVVEVGIAVIQHSDSCVYPNTNRRRDARDGTNGDPSLRVHQSCLLRAQGDAGRLPSTVAPHTLILTVGIAIDQYRRPVASVANEREA